MKPNMSKHIHRSINQIFKINLSVKNYKDIEVDTTVIWIECRLNYLVNNMSKHPYFNKTPFSPNVQQKHTTQKAHQQFKAFVGSEFFLFTRLRSPWRTWTASCWTWPPSAWGVVLRRCPGGSWRMWPWPWCPGRSLRFQRLAEDDCKNILFLETHVEIYIIFFCSHFFGIVDWYSWLWRMKPDAMCRCRSIACGITECYIALYKVIL